jgi:hypothetical protein
MSEQDQRAAGLERDLAAAHRRIIEMIAEIDRRDELISDLQRRVEELEAHADR